MNLSQFLECLFSEGRVTVAGTLAEFDAEDMAGAERLLEARHAEAALEMPGTAPAFDAGAAVWAAKFLYRAAQLTMLRELGDEVVERELAGYEGPVTAEAVFSADLCLRYLPALLDLAGGISPEDVLVSVLHATAAQWPFSATALKTKAETGICAVLAHPSLRRAYVDRVIAEEALAKALDGSVAEHVREALGGHAETLWPEFYCSNQKN